jgi:hypothetical protein
VLAPGERFRRRVTIRFPFNATAGAKTLTGRFTIDADRAYEFHAEAPFSLELAGTSARLFARLMGSDVVVDLAVTNFRDSKRRFDCIAMAPGHATQQRSVGALISGQTIMKRFVFSRAAGLVGKKVRVILREVDGSHVANYETTVR